MSEPFGNGLPPSITYDVVAELETLHANAARKTLRKSVRSNGTFSSAGVLPGDVIDCIEIWNSKEEIDEERQVTRLGTLIVA